MVNSFPIDFSSKMSVFEVNDLIYTGFSTGFEILALYLTILFAYFAMAYLVGKRLNFFQVSAVTLVYSAFCQLLIVAVYAALETPLVLVNLLGSGDYR